MSSAGQGAGGRGVGRARILAGRYRLDEVIGRGGMSTVYRGTDLALDRVVAVKVALDPLAEENPVYVARFKREARAAAAINHPGVVTVYDAGADGTTRFIVMEYVEGRSLAQIMRDEGPLEPARAARIAEQVADTLVAAHAAGIIHRDIKPGNIMLAEAGGPAAGADHAQDRVAADHAQDQVAADHSQDRVAADHAQDPVAADRAQDRVAADHAHDRVGPDRAQDRVKVLDFGIAHTAGAVTLTQTASVLGTAPYMSPEQAMGNPADARSDIYSLGCVLYEMLTGQPPFMADVPAAVLHQHVRVAASPPSSANPAVPPALDALVLQMLAKKPEDRPQTAAEMRDQLAGYASQPPTEATKRLPPAVEALAGVAAAAATVPQVATVPQSATVPPEATAATRVLPAPAPAHRSRRGLWAALAALCVLLLGAAVAFALSGGGTGTSSSAPPHPPATATVTATRGETTRSTSPPASTSTSSTSSTSSSSSTPSTSTTTVTTTATAPPAPGGAPPAPGQTKKKDKKK